MELLFIKRKPDEKTRIYLIHNRPKQGGIMGDEYTNRELDMCFEQINEKLDAIHVLAKNTNGRVGRLENWQHAIKGGMFILVLLVVPVLIYVIKGWIG